MLVVRVVITIFWKYGYSRYLELSNKPLNFKIE